MTPDELRKAISDIDDDTQIHIVLRKEDLPDDVSELQRSEIRRYKDFAVILVRKIWNGALKVARVWVIAITLFPEVVPTPTVFVARTGGIARQMYSSIDFTNPRSAKPQSFIAFNSSTHDTPEKPIPEHAIVENTSYIPISGIPESISLSDMVPSGVYYS